MNNVMYMHGEMENISTILMALGIIINDYEVYQQATGTIILLV